MKIIKTYLPSIVFLTFVFVLSILFVILPKTSYSENEKRILSEAPAFTAEALFDGSLMTDFETYLSDHFPGRDLFVGVNSYYELSTGRGGTSEVYFGSDGYLIGKENEAASEEHVIKNTVNFAAFADTLGLDATMMIVPSSGYILEDKLPAVHADYHDEALLTAAEERADHLQWIDLTETFNKAKADTQLYYKTDHHLTADGSYEMYKAYLQSKGVAPYEGFRNESYDGFYGTYYSRGGYWLTKPDAVELYIDDTLKDITVEVSDGLGEPTVSDSLFFKDHLNNADKYPIYLNGNHGLVKITNPNAKGGKLLIVKDSFAHCVTTMLASHYSEIYMVDLRYYATAAPDSVADLVNNNGIKEALFLYGTDSLATESGNSFKLFYDLESVIATLQY